MLWYLVVFNFVISLRFSPQNEFTYIIFSEWLIAQSGAILAGGFSSGVYTTDSPESVRHIAANARAQVVVVEDRQQLEKVLKVGGGLLLLLFLLLLLLPPPLLRLLLLLPLLLLLLVLLLLLLLLQAPLLITLFAVSAELIMQ